MAKAPFILLINPWITDFAAYDLWAKPLGLCMLAALLREGGCGVALIDCLNRNEPSLDQYPLIPGKKRRYGTGKYPKVAIPKPKAYQDIPRTYFRYGIHPRQFEDKLKVMTKPDLIWITTIMTYWYPGLQETIKVVRSVFPETPIWLGGIYAKLCPEHARRESGADLIVTGPTNLIPKLIEENTGYCIPNFKSWQDFNNYPPPAFDLLGSFDYVPLLTSLGCPFSCPYCASAILQPRRKRRSAQSIYNEILKWHTEFGVRDFAFYDDALLIDAESTLKPALESICREEIDVRFHTPNALHARALSRSWCELLYQSGFKTVRLGLETTEPRHQRKWGNKVDMASFEKAVENLSSAGFYPHQIGVYLLCGLPEQTPEEVERAIDDVSKFGVFPYLAEYSPIPRTPMGEKAATLSAYDILNEPLYHNNTFFACRRPDFTFEDMEELKNYCREKRRLLAQKSQRPSRTDSCELKVLKF